MKGNSQWEELQPQALEPGPGNDHEHPAHMDMTLISFKLSGSYKVLTVLPVTPKTREQNSKDSCV